MKRKLLTNNPNEAVKLLFKHLGLKYNQYVEKCHMAHPLYPGYNSIAYILAYYGLDSCLIKTNKKELPFLPMPAIIYYDGLFLPIANVSKTSIKIITGHGKVEIEPIIMLDRFWDNTILIINNQYDKFNGPAKKELVRFNFNNISGFLTSIILLVIYIYEIIHISHTFIWYDWGFYAICLIGFATSMLFQIQEFNKDNRLINKVCHSRRKGNYDCSSILDSRYSRFWGLFSWADFSLIYYSFLLFLPFCISPGVYRAIFVTLSFVATLYIPYSLVYQWKFAQKWCILCLISQGVLCANFVVSFIFVLFSRSMLVQQIFEWKELILAILVGIIIMALFSISKKFLRQYFQSYTALKKLSAVVFSPPVKNIILSNQPAVTIDAEFQKISINEGNPDTLTIIINPLCSPCMNNLRILLDIYNRKKETRLDVIFFTEDDDNATDFKIASRLMALYYKLGACKFYVFFQKYVNNFPVSTQKILYAEQPPIWCTDIVHIQNNWCISNDIRATPQIFLNSRKISKIFSVHSIDFLIR